MCDLNMCMYVNISTSLEELVICSLECHLFSIICLINKAALNKFDIAKHFEINRPVKFCYVIQFSNFLLTVIKSWLFSQPFKYSA